MNFIANTLGISVKKVEHNYINSFPYYLIDSYNFQEIYLDSVKCTFISLKNDIQNIATIKKNIQKIQQIVKNPVVLELDNITKYRCDALIKEKIPFIVNGKQLYLPFLGIYLQDKFSTEYKPIEKFNPLTQVILFEYIYKCLEAKNVVELSSNDLTKFNLSSMSISRAFKQLEDTNIIISKKYGVNKVIYTNQTPKDLYNKSMPYLINPIRRTVYVDKENLSQLEVKALSGLSQLSNISMLNPPKVITYATYTVPKVKVYSELINSDSQIELEIWKYNPTVLIENGSIDVLSLISSLSSNLDERVQIIIDDLLNNLWNN